MYVNVKLLNGFNKHFLYSIPEDWDVKPQPGSIISVPIKSRHEIAIVDQIFYQKPDFANFVVRPANRLEKFPQDKYYFEYINYLAKYYALEPIDLLARVEGFIGKEDKVKEVIFETNINKDGPDEIKLTSEQQIAFDFISSKLDQNEFVPTLIHGVTGSGKSEIYKKLIFEIINKQKSAIFLLPEVTLAIQFERLFKNFFKNEVEIFSFHSGSSVVQKRALWKALIDEKPVLIIGVHMPILLPIYNLGLIIIDEEHEAGFQEKKHPKINSKEAALIRAKIYKIPIVLGSATPSLTSIYNCYPVPFAPTCPAKPWRSRSEQSELRGANINKRWNYFKLVNRFSGAFPKIKVVNLLSNFKRANFWISKELQDAIKERLLKREQVIVFINRRGFSFFVQCKDCGYIFECKNCSVSLTLHEDDSLSCHYCDYKISMPTNCFKCKASAESFLKKGIGTQQVVRILETIFPYAKIARADLDTSSKKKEFQNTIKKFENGEIDILVGTQTITKGFHFPNVTLVGILWADINFNFPAFNAAEIALQQLIQVAGRAGRAKEQSEVVVQVMSENRLNNFFSELDYPEFVEDELKFRKTFSYPPYSRLVELELKNSNKEQLEKDMQKVYEILRSLILEKNIMLLGPADPAVSKLKNYYRKTFYLKGSNMSELQGIYQKLIENKFKSSIFFVPNPIN